MKTLLIGGFEAGAFDRIAQAFYPLKSDYTLRRITRLGQLQGLLEPLQGDLLLLNMNLSGGKSLEWLAAIADARAALPVLAVGDSQKMDFQEYTKRYPDRYFPQVDYLPESFSEEALLSAVNLGICDTAWGVIGGLSLSTLLQAIHLEKKTCTIRVISGRRQGFLYLRAGVMINARYRRSEGLEAAYLILASESPQAEISGQLHDSTQLIEASMEELLMETARLQDEVKSGDAPEASEEDLDHLPSSELGKWKTMPSPPRLRSAPRHGLWFALAVVALLLAALSTYLLTRKTRLEVLTTPSAVSVSLDGRKCGETPIHLALASLQGRLTLEAPGYVPVSYSLRPGDEKLVFTLEPLPKSAQASPGKPVEEAVPEDAKASSKPRRKTVKTAPKLAPKAKGDVFDQIRKP